MTTHLSQTFTILLTCILTCGIGSTPQQAAGQGSDSQAPISKDSKIQDRAKRTVQSAKKSAAASKKKTRPQFVPPVVDPNLPNVLLIGDSISIGYHLAVRDLLDGQANVFRPPTNCGPTTNGVKSIEQWIGDRKWDVIHFNFGLHDLKYMGPKGSNLADPDSAGSHQQVPIDEYKKNLTMIAKRIKATGAEVIWRETTPVPKGSKGRVPGDSDRYNQAAAEVIAKVGGFTTDPMFQFATDNAQHQLPANVHYTAGGSKILGQHVAKQVADALKQNTAATAGN